MKSSAALFVTFSIVFLLAGNYVFFYSDEIDAREEVIIERAIDGDTVRLRDGRTVRLININTPEKKERGYTDALAFLGQFENRSASLENRGTEKYGRVLGALYVDEEYLNLELVRQGFAHTLLVAEGETRLFFDAQTDAFEARKGIWQRSPLYGCLKAEIDKKEEYLRIESACDSSLARWTVKDETTHPYTLAEPLESHFTLFSGEGDETSEAKYWGRGNAWNNDRDSLFIRDDDELLVLYQSYGY